MLVLLGQQPIPEPPDGSEKEKLQHLLDVYTDRLIAANPGKYVSVPRDTIPEAIIQGLRTRIAEL
ncbi:MAG: hypothetical protein WCS31_04880 [Verrucomicrobiae bacterium]